MDAYSYIANADVNYVDDLYQKYQQDHSTVDESWQYFFKGFDFSAGKSSVPTTSGKGTLALNDKELAVYQLIHAYRSRGHLVSKTNPVRERKDRSPRLDLEDFGLSKDDLETTFEVGKELGLGVAKLKDILAALKKMYESHI